MMRSIVRACCAAIVEPGAGSRGCVRPPAGPGFSRAFPRFLSRLALAALLLGGPCAAAASSSVAVDEGLTASDGSVTTDEDTPYSFAAGDFNFAGADDALASVKIVTGPSAGSLELDGAAVTADRVVTTAQLDNGDLVFTPAANAHGSGYATFTFKVSDGEAESADAYTMTIDVTAVNDAATGAPTISGTTMVGHTLTASTAGIADADGLTGVSYSYQWIRVDSGNKNNPRTIAGATSSRYTLTRDDQYENVMVRVNFTDDDRNDEALTSDVSTRVRASLSSIPASADMLVSNLGQIRDGVRGRFRRIDMAQRFTTGSNAGGYALRSVDLYILADHLSGPTPPTVKIFSGSADGAEVAVLRGPAALELNIEKTYAFTASGPVTLKPSTDYWVVAEGGTANWQGTASDNEDAASASGWSIRDVAEYRDASSTDSYLDAAYNATRIRINGAARGLVFSRTQVAVDEGGTAGYTVKLDARPSASVTVSIASGDADAASVEPASLTFTASDWNIAQTVTVTGVEDSDGNHESVTLTHSVAGFAPRTVTAAVNDNDDGAAPAAASATVTGTSLVIAFDDDLAAAPDLANDAFTVKKTPSGGTERTETLTGSPSVDGRTVTLTLGSAAVSTDTGVTVSYTRPATGSGNRLADGNGNEVAGFTLAATNDTPDCPAGQPADAFATACLTVAEVNFGYGYSLTGGAISSASGAKTWNFTRNGKSYVISEIKTARSGLTNAGLNVVFGANPPPASESWILQVGSRSFRFDARTRYTLFSNVPGHRYVWASPGFTWGAGNYGDRVSVSLRSDAPELTLPLKTEMTGSVPEAAAGGPGQSDASSDASSGGCRVEVSVAFLDAAGDAVAVDALATLAASDFTVENGRAGTPVADADGLGWTVPVRATTNERGFMRVRLPATAHWRAAEQVFRNRAGVCAPAARGELASLWIDDLDISPIFASATTRYTSRTTDAEAEVVATAVYADATVTIAPGDADEERDGHQLALAEGETEVTVTVTPGDGSDARTYTVTVTREPAVTGAGVLTGLVLVDAVTDADLGPITEGGTVTVSAVGIYGIRAEVDPDAEVGSVVLTLSNPVAKSEEHRQTENVVPYSLFGDAEGAEHGRALAAGSYTLTATAHEHPHGAGKALGTLRAPFKVEVEAGTESSPGVLSGFVLLDASDQSTVAALTDGAEVDLGGRSGGTFAIRANVVTNATVGSVALSLSGAKTVSATENLAPYSLWGDHNDGNGGRALDGASLPAGTYTLAATAYAEARASGTVLGTLSVSFEVLAPAALSVADARAEEGTDANLDFAVTLDRETTATVTVDYATADGTATAGSDYTATSGTLTFAAGETEKTVSVPVLEDDHDEGSETLTLRLSNPQGAIVAKGEGTGTITNDDPIPEAWLARFGRTVTGQVLDAVEARLTASRQAGVRASLAGQALPSWTPGPGSGTGAVDKAAPERLSAADTRGRGAMETVRSWMAGTDAGRSEPGGPGSGAFGGDGRSGFRSGFRSSLRSGFQSWALTPRDFLTGSSFALTAKAGDGRGAGHASLWGRGAIGSFDGREGSLTVDGEVTTGLIGADWASDPGSKSGAGPGSGRWTAGLAIGHSTGTGGYRRGGECDANCGGRIEATLTGLYPYAGMDLTERLSVWAAAGYGAGEVTVTPEGKAGMTADLTMAMGAAGLRSAVLRPEAGDGLSLAVKGDARFTRTSSDATSGMAASEADVWLVRAGVEGSRRFALPGSGSGTGDGATLSPIFELALRLDGGDAETGFGADLGGGLAFADPASGLSLDLKGRVLLAHAAKGFREWGASGAFAWNPRPTTDRGLALTLRQSWGASPAGGMNALLSRETLAGFAANDNPGKFEASSRLEGEIGYGLPMFGGAFTGTPNIGFGLSGGGARDWRLGWRLTSAAPGDPGFEIGLDAARREPANDDGPPEHEVTLRAAIRF